MRFMMAVGVIVALLFLLVGFAGNRPIDTETFGEPWSLQELTDAMTNRDPNFVVEEVRSEVDGWRESDEGLDTHRGIDQLQHLGPFVWAKVSTNRYSAGLFIYGNEAARRRDWEGDGTNVEPIRYGVSDVSYHAFDNIVVIESPHGPTGGLGEAIASLAQ